MISSIEKIASLDDVPAECAPYVVLVGNCETGKSTLVEKLTGETGLSSNAAITFTRSSEYFWVPDKSLMIADTPSPVLIEKFESNMQIAHALNHHKVSYINIHINYSRLSAWFDFFLNLNYLSYSWKKLHFFVCTYIFN